MSEVIELDRIASLGGIKAAEKRYKAMRESLGLGILNRKQVKDFLEFERAMRDYRREHKIYGIGDLVVYIRNGILEDMLHEVVGHTEDWKGIKQLEIRMTDSGNVHAFYVHNWRHATQDEIDALWSPTHGRKK